MGRPRKKGLDYIPLDVHFFDDRRIRKLNSKYSGGKASFVFLRLWAEIYQNGFYIKLTEDDIQFLAYESRIRKDIFRKIIEDLINEGFFDRDKYEQFNVLTSENIQRDYFTIKNAKSHVQITSVEAEYLIIDISNFKNIVLIKSNTNNEKDSFSEKNPQKTSENLSENEPSQPENSQKKTISKVKKSKVKEKESEVKDFSSENPPNSPPNFSKKDLEKFKNEIIKQFPDFLRPQTEEELQQWYEQYKLLRLKLPHKQIVEIIHYGLNDSFWKQNISSLSYLLTISRKDGVPIWKKLLTQFQALNKDNPALTVQNPQKVNTDVRTI